MIRHMVALDSRRGIARRGIEPWDLPTDRRYFMEQTKTHGGIVLMGRKTYEVIGDALPDRQNFVLTHDAGWAAPGVVTVNDLDGFLAAQQEVWIIGGGQLFSQTLLRAAELYITEIDADFGCDIFYPEYRADFQAPNAGAWQTENGQRYRFTVYTPKIPQ